MKVLDKTLRIWGHDTPKKEGLWVFFMVFVFSLPLAGNFPSLKVLVPWCGHRNVSSWEFRGASARPPNATGRIRWSSFGPWWLIKGTMSNRWRRFWDSEILEVSFQVVFCKDLTMVALLKMNMEEACGSFSSRMTAWQPYHMKRNSCWLQLCWNRTRTQPTNRIFCELTCSKQIWNISELIYR